jgi:hypothetical protein
MAARPGGLLMEPTARLMIHDGFAMAAGNAAELAKMVEQLNSASDTIASIYASRTGKPQADWRAAMVEETWYTAEAAVAAGLADAIVGATNRAMQLVNRTVTSGGVPVARKDCPACQAHVTDVTAKFCAQCGGPVASFSEADPAAGGHLVAADAADPYDPDGDGDDDSTPEGDTDHDHWAPDGTQLKSVPGKPMPDSDDDETTNFLVSALRDAAQTHAVMNGTHSHPHPAYGTQDSDADTHDHSHTHAKDATHSHSHDAADDGKKKPFPGAAKPFEKGSVDFSPWNAAKAWHDAAMSADPATFYAGICAGRRPGDPTIQSSWALPYRYKPGDPPNADGVAAALERLPGLDGLVNTTEATVVLAAARDVADLARGHAELERAQAAIAAINAAQSSAGVHEHLSRRDAVRRGAVTPVDPFRVLMTDGVDDTVWNASKAWHAGAASPDPAAFYAGICAGEKAGDKSTQSAWALPYRYTPSSAPNAAGVKNALARLEGTDGLTNAAEAKAKLRGLMKKINPDYEPDDLAELFRSVHFALKEG